MNAYNISFIGAGNVATALCHGLKKAGHNILSVYSKGGENARRLAAETGALWVKDNTAPGNCDIVIMAVNDIPVNDVARTLSIPDKAILVHTAGSVPLKALGRDARAGVLYPLQTFSKGHSPELTGVPFFIEATDKKTIGILNEICLSLGAQVSECDSEHRVYLHVAAVFTNNFSNFMMTLGETIASGAGFDPALLRPLMKETIKKTLLTGPGEAQTGPAVRHDTLTMNNHIELLSFSPEYQELYRQISKLIMAYYKKEEDDKFQGRP